ncbi:MAG: glutamine synthetase beta-grasp domain-containing protein [Planctomycetota bacterium]|jgi:glutamine synthetase
MLRQAEYIWLDGAEPTRELRSKTRIVAVPADGPIDVSSFPTWSFDGSSTNQADGDDSDLSLVPVRVVPDPIRGSGNYLVLCEVTHGDGTPHRTNTRAELRQVLAAGGADEDAWVGFEQEYTLFRDGRPLGFPDNGFPAPQGPFYCGVGSDRIHGRDFVEAHTAACLDAGLMIYGINAEVMPGQWEFQVGYRGVDGERADPLTVSDHLLIARWLLRRIGEGFGVDASLDPKPATGDWNGAGAHTNFSTRAMREPGGVRAIREAIRRLGASHDRHVADYGHGLADRLTGLHETCSIDEFRGGVADRGASIRIPRHVQVNGCGYLEDRRPGANCDPYLVCARLLETICDVTTPLAKAG